MSLVKLAGLITLTVPGTYTIIPPTDKSSLANLGECRVVCRTDLGAFTINIPQIASLQKFFGLKLLISDIGNNASVNNITINASAGDKIQSVTSIKIDKNLGSSELQIATNGLWSPEFSSSSSPAPTPPANLKDYYLNGNVAVSGDGSFSSPFKTLFDAVAKLNTYSLAGTSVNLLVTPYENNGPTVVLPNDYVLNIIGETASNCVFNESISIVPLIAGGQFPQYRQLAFNGGFTADFTNVTPGNFNSISFVYCAVGLQVLGTPSQGITQMSGGIFSSSIEGECEMTGLLLGDVTCKSGCNVSAVDIRLLPNGGGGFAGKFLLENGATLKTLGVINPANNYIKGVAGTSTWLTDAESNAIADGPGIVNKTVYGESSTTPYGLDTGIVNAYVVSLPTITSLVDGQNFEVKIQSATNTLASTITINPLSATKAIVDSDGNAIVPSTLILDSTYLFAYNSDYNAYQLLGTARPASVDSVNGKTGIVNLVLQDVINGAVGNTLRHNGVNWVADNTIYNDGTNLGFGTVTPTAKGHFVGVDATAGAWGLKVDNSAVTNFSVRNDGFSSFRTTTERFDEYVRVLGGVLIDGATNNSAGLAYGLFVDTDIPNGGTDKKIARIRGTLPESGKALYLDTTFGTGTDSFMIDIAHINNTTITNAYGLRIDVNGATNNYGIFVDRGVSGFGGLSNNTKLYSKGVDATSSNYAFKADNVAGVNMFSVRNDTFIAVNNATQASFEVFGINGNMRVTSCISIGSTYQGFVGNAITADTGFTLQIGGAQKFGQDGSGNTFMYGSDLVFANGNAVEKMRMKDNGSLGINTPSPDSTAILDVVSTTKGVLFPRMTTVQKTAISTPANGLVVFDTTLNKLCVYTTAWETVTSI